MKPARISLPILLVLALAILAMAFLNYLKFTCTLTDLEQSRRFCRDNSQLTWQVDVVAESQNARL